MALASMLALLFIPGYALVRGLFDKKRLTLSWTLGLSFFFGLTPPLLIYALNKNVNVPVSSYTSVVTAVFITLVGVILWWGKQR